MDNIYSNQISDIVNQIVKDINDKKQEAFILKCMELGIVFNIKEEEERRFKNFIREVKGNRETIYYNDGSIEGLRIITFITDDKFDYNDIDYKYSVISEIKYY